jgi:hypothetical protein
VGTDHGAADRDGGDWAKAQTTFARNLSTGAHTDGHTREYLLKRLIFCGACGRRYVGGRSHGAPLYVCCGRDSLLGDRRCFARTIRADVIEPEVQRTIMQVLDNPNVLYGAAAVHHNRVAGRQVDVRREAEVAQKELAVLQRHRANLLDLAVDGTIDKRIFTERDAPLRIEEERLTRRVAELRTEAASSAAAASTQRAVLAHAKLLRRGLGKLNETQWRDFLVKLVEKIVVGPDGLEVHLVLPTQVSQRSNQASNRATTLARSGGGSFSSSW